MCDCCIRRCVQTCKLSSLEPKSVPRSLQKMLAESIGEPVWRQNMSVGASCLSWICTFAFWSSGRRAQCAGDAVVSLVWGSMLKCCYLLMVSMVWVILLVCVWNKKRFRELCVCAVSSITAMQLNYTVNSQDIAITNSFFFLSHTSNSLSNRTGHWFYSFSQSFYEI